MISTQGKRVKKELIGNKNLENILNVPLEIQRKQWEDSALDVKLPEGTCIEEIVVKNISAEWVTTQNSSKQNVILYFHGGGYNQGSSITHRKLVAHIAHSTNLPVMIHNYPLAPENPYPAALNSSEQVYTWLLDNGFKPENILLGGDSSGGGLALALMLLLKSKNYLLPKAAFLLSPMLDLTFSGDTIKTCAQSDPLIFEEDLLLTASYYCSDESPYNPLISPVYGEFEGFPPLLIQVGSDELLLSDSIRVAEKAKAAGVDVRLDIWNEMWHVFQAWVEDVPEANRAIEKIGRFMEHVLNI
ncbi:MAG: alpha/beta hydrolase [Clostridia bacterium]|nr:alpha/beta hydrolase [Clostridia bacterium]